jgi:hypothetical protein
MWSNQALELYFDADRDVLFAGESATRGLGVGN